MALYPDSDHDRDLKELLDNYRNLRAGNPHRFIDEESFEAIAQYYDNRDQLNKALEALEFATTHFPFSSVLLIKKADLLIATGQYQNALAILEQVEILDQNDINLYILKTDAYLATDQQGKAIKLLENVLSQFYGKEKIELLFELADVYDDHENFHKVFDCLQIILEIDPTNEEALYKICFWADFTGRNEESIKIHQKIIDEHPFNELAWFNLGSAFQGLKLYEKAVDAYEYVLAIDEKFDYAYRNIGDAFIRLKKYKEAIDNLLKVLELAKPEEVIYDALGFCYEKLKLPAEARFYYKKASHLSPENASFHFKMASTYMKENQWKNAIKIMENALRIHKKNPEYNFAIAQCYFQIDDLNQTIYHLSITLQHKAKNTKAWELLLICLYQLSEFKQGIEFCDTAYINTNNKVIFLFYKVAFLHAIGNTKEAIQLLETALTIAPKMIKYLIELEPLLLQHSEFVNTIAKYKH